MSVVELILLKFSTVAGQVGVYIDLDTWSNEPTDVRYNLRQFVSGCQKRGGAWVLLGS